MRASVLAACLAVMGCQNGHRADAGRFQVVRTIERESMGPDYEVVRDPTNGRCFLRSYVNGGAVLTLLPDCS